jgi:hypothetical protein
MGKFERSIRRNGDKIDFPRMMRDARRASEAKADATWNPVMGKTRMQWRDECWAKDEAFLMGKMREGMSKFFPDLKPKLLADGTEVYDHNALAHALGVDPEELHQIAENDPWFLRERARAERIHSMFTTRPEKSGEDGYWLNASGVVLSMVQANTKDMGNPAYRVVVSQLQRAADTAVAYWAIGFAKRELLPALKMDLAVAKPTDAAGISVVTGDAMLDWFRALVARLEKHNADQESASGIKVNPAAYRVSIEANRRETVFAYVGVLDAILFGDEMPPSPADPRDALDA